MSQTGLAFSGGGIRSAAFCSGVLRRLLQREVKVNYLSCVSGGGYTGTAYLDWKYRHDQKDDPKWHQEFFNYMRSRAGYFCNWENPVAAIFDTLFTVALIALVSVIFPIIVWMSYACPVAYVVDFLAGHLLRAEVCTEGSAENPTHAHGHGCSVDVNRRILLLAILLAVAVFSFMLENISSHGKMTFRFISTSVRTILALLILPWAIHKFLERTPGWVQALILVLAAIIWFSSPVFRQQASLVMVLYAYAYIIHMRVYRHSLLGFTYSEYSFNIVVWISGIMLCVVPIAGSIQQRLMHVFNR